MSGFLRISILLVLLAITPAIDASAQEASPWQVDSHSALRLIAGSRSGGVMLGGVAIRLDAGWKTYWRTPGDSGVPPRFDFSKSENLDAVTILWPAPTAFDDGAGGLSLGYTGSIVLPLRISAKASDRPVILRAAVSYAVCEKLCLPVDAEAEVTFANVASSQDTALVAALGMVPKPVALGDSGPLTIQDVRRDGHRVTVTVAAPPGSQVGLYAEGPTPDWALSIPKLQASDGELRRYIFDLEGLPPDAQIAGAEIRFTLVGADQAREFAVKLD